MEKENSESATEHFNCIVSGGIWKASAIEQTPSISLRNWRIYEVSSELWEKRTRHFSGYNITEYEGRASTCITEFDQKKMIGRTESGRIYQLVGPPGNHSDGDYVWNWFASRNKLHEIKDVSGEYYSPQTTRKQ